MSDAKSAAEARRAKILARANSKTNTVSVASSEDVTDESLYNQLANPSKPADSRPIANRRRMIGSRSSSDIAGTAAAADATTSPAVTPTKPADDGEISDVTPSKTAVDKTVDEKTDSVEKTEEKATEQPANVNTVAAVTTPASKETATTTTPNTTETKKSVLPPAKSIEEVEREIAEATMKSDEKTLKKDDENTVKTGRFGRKSAGGATSTDGKISAAAANALKVKPIAIDPSNVMRLIRVIMIILLAAFTGYRTVENSRLEAIKVKSMESLMATKSADFDFGNADFQFDTPPVATTNTIPSMESEDPAKTRTWAGYFQEKLTRQAECSVTAVGLVWWMSRFFSPVVNSQFKQEQKQMKPLEMAMEFLTNGINAFKETIYSSFGEISLHFFVLIVSVTLFTMYFSAEMNDAGTGNSAAISNIEL